MKRSSPKAVETADDDQGSLDEADPLASDDPRLVSSSRPSERRELTLRLPALPRLGAWPNRLRPVLIVLVVLLSAASGFVWWKQHQERQIDRGADAAARTAADSIDRLLTFRPATVFEELPEEKKLLTGDLADEYENELTTDWGPNVVENKISTEVAVPDYGIIERGENETVVLVFANMTRRTASSDETEIITSTMRVTMRLVDDVWRISAYEGI